MMETFHVVVGYDFGPSGRAALLRGIELANRTPSMVLHVIYAIDRHVSAQPLPYEGHIDYRFAERIQTSLVALIREQLEVAEIADRIHFGVHARIGKPADEILALAREIGADMIIVGSTRVTGLERWVLGSVSEAVVRDAGCSVEVSRAKEYANVKLLDIVEKESAARYTPPHRYTYDAHLNLRPAEWPLY